MKLVTQHPHSKACMLACVAMIEGVSLQEVIQLAGSDQPPSEDSRRKITEHFGKEEFYNHRSWRVENYTNRSVGALIKQHTTLLCAVSSSIDPNFAHAVVIHNNDLYDPHAGMNPTWPWDRVITRVSVIA